MPCRSSSPPGNWPVPRAAPCRASPPPPSPRGSAASHSLSSTRRPARRGGISGWRPRRPSTAWIRVGEGITPVVGDHRRQERRVGAASAPSRRGRSPGRRAGARRPPARGCGRPGRGRDLRHRSRRGAAPRASGGGPTSTTPSSAKAVIAAHRHRPVEAAQASGDVGTVEELAGVLAVSAAGHTADPGVGIDAGAQARGGGEELGDRGRLAILLEGRRALDPAKGAPVADRGEDLAGRDVDDHDAAAVIAAEGFEGEGRELEVEAQADRGRVGLGGGRSRPRPAARAPVRPRRRAPAPPAVVSCPTVRPPAVAQQPTAVAEPGLEVALDAPGEGELRPGGDGHARDLVVAAVLDQRRGCAPGARGGRSSSAARSVSFTAAWNSPRSKAPRGEDLEGIGRGIEVAGGGRSPACLRRGSRRSADRPGRGRRGWGEPANPVRISPAASTSPLTSSSVASARLEVSSAQLQAKITVPQQDGRQAPEEQTAGLAESLHLGPVRNGPVTSQRR